MRFSVAYRVTSKPLRCYPHQARFYLGLLKRVKIPPPAFLLTQSDKILERLGNLAGKIHRDGAKARMQNVKSHPHPEVAQMAETPSLIPLSGWHCRHYLYRFNRDVLQTLSKDDLALGIQQFIAAFDPQSMDSPAQLQVLLIGGHKADFGYIALDADPCRVDGIHYRLLSGRLGPALQPAYSFVSLTEVSEYLPTPAQYAERLRAEGWDPESEEFKKQLRQFEKRLEVMYRRRLTPDLPMWPAVSFYPMNKRRTADANWFLLPFEERERLMHEHGETGMKFAGKVVQMVTAGIGLEDWEWGVTLWATNPQYLKDIVYRMRFDQVSARYAEFGPFYFGWLADPKEVLRFCRVGLSEVPQ